MLLSKGLLSKAWNHKFPQEAVAYREALLAAADVTERGKGPKQRRSLLSRLGFTKEREPVAVVEQLDTVRSAGRWFIFGGERGHPIRAWF